MLDVLRAWLAVTLSCFSFKEAFYRFLSLSLLPSCDYNDGLSHQRRTRDCITSNHGRIRRRQRPCPCQSLLLQRKLPECFPNRDTVDGPTPWKSGLDAIRADGKRLWNAEAFASLMSQIRHGVYAHACEERASMDHTAKQGKMSNTAAHMQQTVGFTILTGPILLSWSVENTISLTKNSILLERDSLLMSPRHPSPFSLWGICSSCLLVLLSAGPSVWACVSVCAPAEVGLPGRLALGVLWHLPLWRGLACTLVRHRIYQWLIVTEQVTLKTQQRPLTSSSTKAARRSHAVGAGQARNFFLVRWGFRSETETQVRLV